jgi:hypothetical protein
MPSTRVASGLTHYCGTVTEAGVGGEGRDALADGDRGPVDPLGGSPIAVTRFAGHGQRGPPLSNGGVFAPVDLWPVSLATSDVVPGLIGAGRAETGGPLSGPPASAVIQFCRVSGSGFYVKGISGGQSGLRP